MHQFIRIFLLALVQKGDYNVLTTNYDDYALVYACRTVPILDVKLEFIWFLS